MKLAGKGTRTILKIRKKRALQLVTALFELRP